MHHHLLKSRIHKSTGLMVAGLTLPRIALALLARRPGPLPGSPGLLHSLEHFAASVSHLALYFFMVALPSTGIAMGYYGGKGETLRSDHLSQLAG